MTEGTFDEWWQEAQLKMSRWPVSYQAARMAWSHQQREIDRLRRALHEVYSLASQALNEDEDTMCWRALQEIQTAALAQGEERL